jgi:methyl-accepting chemotaxis protein
MKIREKLLSLPAIVLVFMMILGGVAILAMNNMATSARDIYEIQFKKYQLSSETLDEARAANIGVYRLFTWMSNYDEKKIKSVAVEIDQKIDKAMDNTRELLNNYTVDSTQKSDLQQVLDSLAIYKKEIAEAIEMAEVDPNMGLTSMQTADKTFLSLQEKIQNVVAATDKSAREQYESTVAASKNAIKKVVVILLVAVFSSIAISLWLGQKIIASLTQAINFAKRIASGDLTGSIQVKGNDEIADLELALSDMKLNLHQIVSGITSAVDELQTLNKGLNGSSSLILYGIEQQHKAATTMASAVEQMSMNINVINTHASAADSAMKDSNQLAIEGRAVLGNVKSSMQRIENSSQDTLNVVESLGQESEQISNIVSVIKSIADQTNLLALNAAIEAARAGEQGRGFAVVADEVRSLAARTASSTLEITSMINAIQKGVAGAVSGMQSGVALVGDGGTLAYNAEKAVEQSVIKISEVTSMVSEMTFALREQRLASEMIAKEVHHIAEMGEQNSLASMNTTNSIAQLNELSINIQKMVSRFHI